MKPDMLRMLLAEIFGPEKVSWEPEALRHYAHDHWLLDLQRLVHGKEIELPLCLVRAGTETDVAALMSFAHRENLAVVPIGGGSGVCGAARPGARETALDLRGLNRIICLDEVNLTVTCEAGVIGWDLEQYLNERGYSLGHFPQSIKLSTVGGWVSTRASGQFSTKYGSIEKILVCLRAVLADGTVISTKNSARSACGPNLNELFLGAEGTLGVITELTLKMHPLPEKQLMAAFEFENMRAGLESIRLILRQGWHPALVRLYDAVDCQRHFPADQIGENKCALLLLSEGPEALAEAELAGCFQVCAGQGGRSLGDAPVKHWLGKRFEFPNLRQLAEEKGAIFDTIEITASWDKAHTVYEEAIKALQAIPGIALAYAHSSHSYEQGTCLYITFAVAKPFWVLRKALQWLTGGRLGKFKDTADLKAIEAVYNRCWQEVMAVALKHGGSISHHHGIGKMRLPWMDKELGSSLVLLKRIKNALDPQGNLNPHTLLPE